MASGKKKRSSTTPRMLDPSDPLHASIESATAGMTLDERMDWLMNIGRKKPASATPAPQKSTDPMQPAEDALTAWYRQQGMMPPATAKPSTEQYLSADGTTPASPASPAADPAPIRDPSRNAPERP